MPQPGQTTVLASTITFSSWVIALDDHISHVTVPTAGGLSQTLITLH